MVKVLLKKGKGGATYGRHPWLMASCIDAISGQPKAGDIVEILGENKEYLGTGFYNPNSQIRVRVYSWTQEALDKNWLKNQILKAIQFRKAQLNYDLSAGAYRIIFSEADGLSGVIADKYNDWVVLQINSLAMFQKRETIVEVLQKELNLRGVFLKADSKVQKQENYSYESEVIFGEVPDEDIIIEENNIKYQINLKKGQKTGFFIDQRDHRFLLRNFAKDKKVLDLCTYSGGFALNVAYAGATAVVGVDSSQAAIVQARENAEINQLKNVEFIEADLYKYLTETQQKFDIVILDPPRLSPSKFHRESALRAYFKYNETALKVLNPGGLFVTFSCSGQILREDFNKMFHSVTRRLKRNAKIIHYGGQPADHPILAACPETTYLKSIFSFVE